MLNIGTTFTIIPGTVTGTFAGLSNGTAFSSGGLTFRVNYASVTLTVISPPSIPTLSWWGLGLLSFLLAALALWGRPPGLPNAPKARG
jgi:hypothetical protein